MARYQNLISGKIFLVLTWSRLLVTQHFLKVSKMVNKRVNCILVKQPKKNIKILNPAHPFLATPFTIKIQFVSFIA